jgi:hypothetical protein
MASILTCHVNLVPSSLLPESPLASVHVWTRLPISWSAFGLRGWGGPESTRIGQRKFRTQGGWHYIGRKGGGRCLPAGRRCVAPVGRIDAHLSPPSSGLGLLSPGGPLTLSSPLESASPRGWTDTHPHYHTGPGGWPLSPGGSPMRRTRWSHRRPLIPPRARAAVSRRVADASHPRPDTPTLA